MLVQAQLVSDVWVRLDLRLHDWHVHRRNITCLWHDRRALFQIVQLLLSQWSLELRLARWMRHSDHLLNLVGAACTIRHLFHG